MSDEIKITIRPGTVDDRGFIASTWAKGIYFGDQNYRELPEEVFFKWFPRIVSKVLKSKDVRTAVACDENHPEWILGCAVFDETSVYWVFIKDGFRKQGIASLLLQGKTIQSLKALVPSTRAGMSVANKKSLKIQPL